MKNTLLRLAVLWNNLWIQKNRFTGSCARFLIVSTTGLGDALFATPSIRHLKKTFPHAYIGALVTRASHEVLFNNPDIDEFFIVQRPILWHALLLQRILRKKKIEIVFVLHASQRIILPLCAAIGAQTVIGTQNLHKGLDDLLDISIPKNPIHEIERRLEIVYAVTLQKSARETPRFFLTDQEKEAGKKILEKIPKPIIVLHPGAKDRYKRWPKEFFLQAMHLMEKKKPCSFIITGTKNEKDLLDFFTKNIPQAHLLFDLSLRKYASFLSLCDLIVTNDTGPLHLAAALHIPSVALFSPTDPCFSHPYHASSNILYKPPTCSPCLRRKCSHPSCLEQITPEEVAEKALSLLQ
ncbi:MAG: glycosyltransferase family 9 protein [Parachlamydiales bacterium]|nr:glycosyltransferase family 9 protein [Parachlamydiales bacterium]